MDEDFTPETLRGLAEQVNELLSNFDEISEYGADPLAEQHWFLALKSLETAVNYFKIAAIFQSRALP